MPPSFPNPTHLTPSHSDGSSVRPLARLVACFASAVLPWGSARAQLADVPPANRQGDFYSTRLQGHRDVYSQRQWLVVTRDPEGLNCRDPQGRVVAVLAYGSVVDSDLSKAGGEGIVRVTGHPWLRLIVHPFDLLRDWRPPQEQNRVLACQVRANAAYVAPLNPDTLTPAEMPALNDSTLE